MKHILITGGTGLIGSSLVSDFVKKGWYVITTSRNPDYIFEGISNDYIKVLQVDFLLDDNPIDKLLSQLKDNNLVQIDALVNNARSTDTLKVKEDGYSEDKMIMDEYYLDVVVPYQLSIAIAKLSTVLKSIVNIGSIYGARPFKLALYDGDVRRAPIQYSLAKAALLQLTKELAIRLANKRVRVNQVSYGGVKGRASAEFEEKYQNMTPYKGMIEVGHTAAPVAFLVSDEAEHITGIDLLQDGGWTL